MTGSQALTLTQLNSRHAKMVSRPQASCDCLSALSGTEYKELMTTFGKLSVCVCVCVCVCGGDAWHGSPTAVSQRGGLLTGSNYCPGESQTRGLLPHARPQVHNLPASLRSSVPVKNIFFLPGASTV